MHALSLAYLACSAMSVLDCLVPHLRPPPSPKSYQVTKRRRLEDCPDSAFSGLLTQSVGQGDQYITHAVRFAQAVCQDVSQPPPAVQQWASLGNQAKHRANLERDLHVWLRNMWGVELELSYMPLTVNNLNGEGQVEIMHPYVEPYLLFHEMENASEQQFRRSCLGSDAAACSPRQFWSHCAKVKPDWFCRHPVRLMPERWDDVIPIRTHGDGARFCKASKLLIVSTSSALSRGNSWDTRFLYTVVPDELMVPNVTIQQVHKRLAKSVNCLLSGVINKVQERTVSCLLSRQAQPRAQAARIGIHVVGPGVNHPWSVWPLREVCDGTTSSMLCAHLSRCAQTVPRTRLGPNSDD